jgi:UDP-N-acetylglucosamine 2-epimerase
MPEEINRVIADHLSDHLFCPTAAAVDNLAREGLASRTVLSGDVMFDAVLANTELAERNSSGLFRTWGGRKYALATIHRAENTDHTEHLKVLISALERIAVEICPVILPIHPRTRKVIAENNIAMDRITCLPPLSYREMLVAEKYAQVILTDSGGVQKEAYFFRVPCITLRNETEWTETLEHSCNVLAGNMDPEQIVNAARRAHLAGPWADHYGDGSAALKIVDFLFEAQGRIIDPAAVAGAGDA